MRNDLFRIDLDDLDYQDIVSLTGIMRSETERPQEGIRLEYKGNFPEDLGDIVTAFSNTFGGLILIGVKTDKDKQNIPIEITGIKGNKDIRPTIVNKILSTVYPRPSFAVGMVLHPDKSDHVVIVIRVDESNNTPHMFVAGHNNKISIRIEDSNRSASLQQIESLFEKRNRFLNEDFAMSPSNIYILWNDENTGIESRSNNYHRIAIVPVRSLGIRLDRKKEQEFKKSVKKLFYKDSKMNNEYRQAKYFQIEARDKIIDSHRKWRISSTGSLEFISQIGKGRPRIENLGDMFVDTLLIFYLYKLLVTEYGYWGDSYFQHEMSVVRDTQLVLEMPPDYLYADYRDYDRMDGVQIESDDIIGNIPPDQRIHVIDRFLAFSDIEKPEDIIADSYLEHLRNIYLASIDFDKLKNNINILSEILSNNGIIEGS